MCCFELFHSLHAASEYELEPMDLQLQPTRRKKSQTLNRSIENINTTEIRTFISPRHRQRQPINNLNFHVRKAISRKVNGFCLGQTYIFC